MHSRMHRRHALTATGAGSVPALAGCQNAAGSVAIPTVPGEMLSDGGWRMAMSCASRFDVAPPVHLGLGAETYREAVLELIRGVR